MDHVIVRGFGLYGKDHAVSVPTLRGNPVVPKRAKKALCGIRVQVTSEPFTSGPIACKVCQQQLLPKEDT